MVLQAGRIAACRREDMTMPRQLTEHTLAQLWLLKTELCGLIGQNLPAFYRNLQTEDDSLLTKASDQRKDVQCKYKCVSSKWSKIH